MSNKKVTLYTDGACEGNPGPGGYGVVLLFNGVEEELSGGYLLTTNNRMEIMAAVVGLEVLDEPSSVRIYSDSKYLVEAMSKGWAANWEKSGWVRKGGKRVPNADLWTKLLSLCEIHEVSFEWVKGHSGDHYNERADKLSYAAIESRDLPEDDGYLKQLEEELTSPSQMTQEGQPCRKCSTPVVKKVPRRPPKPGQSYYFEYYLYCPGCKSTYLVEAAKRPIMQSSFLDEET